MYNPNLNPNPNLETLTLTQPSPNINVTLITCPNHEPWNGTPNIEPAQEPKLSLSEGGGGVQITIQYLLNFDWPMNKFGT